MNCTTQEKAADANTAELAKEELCKSDFMQKNNLMKVLDLFLHQPKMM